MKLYISFTALEQTIGEQLSDQGFKFDKRAVENFEKDRMAIYRLLVRDVLSNYNAKKVEGVLLKKIGKYVQGLNKVSKLKTVRL